MHICHRNGITWLRARGKHFAIFMKMLPVAFGHFERCLLGWLPTRVPERSMSWQISSNVLRKEFEDKRWQHRNFSSKISQRFVFTTSTAESHNVLVVLDLKGSPAWPLANQQRCCTWVLAIIIRHCNEHCHTHTVLISRPHLQPSLDTAMSTATLIPCWYFVPTLVKLPLTGTNRDIRAFSNANVLKNLQICLPTHARPRNMSSFPNTRALKPETLWTTRPESLIVYKIALNTGPQRL